MRHRSFIGSYVYNTTCLSAMITCTSVDVLAGPISDSLDSVILAFSDFSRFAVILFFHETFIMGDKLDSIKV